MRPLRTSLSTLLMLAVLVTGQAMAQARGTTRVAGEMVLCTGRGPVTVSVDVDGQPVQRAHFCPDCVLSLWASVGGASVVPLFAWGVPGLAKADAQPGGCAPLHRVSLCARGPPCLS